MNVIEKIKEYNWAIMLGLMLLLYFKQCGISRDIDRIEKSDKSQVVVIDSLHKHITGLKLLSKDEVRYEMDQVMLDFLIYEDDLDKGKTSLSDIKNRVNDKERE